MEGLEIMKIVIFGSNGFIGANLTDYFLSKGHEVIPVVRSSKRVPGLHSFNDSAPIETCNLLDREKIHKILKEYSPGGIINTAMYGGYPGQMDEDSIFDTNFRGTVNLVNEAISMGFDWFINTGSSSEYGSKATPMREDDICEPIDAYGISKLAGTLYCQAKARSLNLPIFTLRLFSVYGYFEKSTRLIPHLILSAIMDEKPNLSSPTPMRDFIFIEDVNKAYYLISSKFKEIGCGEILNVGSGFGLRVGEVVQTLSEVIEKKIIPNWGQAIGRQSDKTKVWTSDIAKIKRILGWEPEYDIRKGLMTTYNWFLNNIEKYQGEYK
ncbi:MAG: NAD(P)-dependent oxidoreductase [Thermoplasmatales archaeon]